MTEAHGEKPRALSRNETHDLGMIIKDRAKVLRAHVDERVAVCMADFERSWRRCTTSTTTTCGARRSPKRSGGRRSRKKDRRPVQGTRHPVAIRAVARHRMARSRRERDFATPYRIAPRREDPRRRDGARGGDEDRTPILDLRTQIVAMGLLSPEARLFLESLAPVDEAMRSLEFRDVEAALEDQAARRRRGDYS